MASLSGTGSTPMKNCIVVICKEFFTLLNSVKQLTLVTTMEEVLDALKKYIFDRKLFDAENPSRIQCQNDELGRVFGLTEFSIADIKKILLKLVLPLPCDNSAGDIYHSVKAPKRSPDLFVDTRVSKRVCLSPHTSNNLPMILEIPKSPIQAAESDTADSIGGYSTSYVKDTSDDNTWLEAGSDSDSSLRLQNGDMLTIAETYDIEYEVDSDCSSDVFFSSCSDSDSEALDTIITFVCRTDSDEEFFADKSSDEDDLSDAEITQSDHWTCKNCGKLNEPPMRCCLKCWETRRGWLAENSRAPPHPKRKKMKKIHDKYHLLGKQEKPESNVSKSLDLPSTSKKEENLKVSVAKSLKQVPLQKKTELTDEKLCLICCERIIDSSIIHGKYGHSISCYTCGNKLKKRNKGCPICRRTIERVVHLISVA